ncbi:MAG: hypothetical protein WD278_09005 [Pirellulales bacterium]
MVSETFNELASFHRFISDRLQRDDTRLSPEEALELWRSQHPSPEEYSETVDALREALGDMERGDTGMPLEQFDHEFRRRRNIGDNS